MRILSDTFPPNKRAVEAYEWQQAQKVREEYQEWFAARYEEKGDPIEEALDLMITIDGWLDKQPEEAVRAAIAKVLRKGEERGDWEGREAVTKFSDIFGILADKQEGVD